MPQITAPAKSLLKETIESFSEQGAIKGKAVRNTLIKKGVKPAELDHATLPELDPDKSYTKAELMDWLSKRQDQHTISESKKYRQVNTLKYPTSDADYDKAMTLEEGYKANITEVQRPIPTSDKVNKLGEAIDSGDNNLVNQTIKEIEGPMSDKVRGSTHFEEKKDYLFHTRTYDDSPNSIVTDDISVPERRTILEVQSDVASKLRREQIAAANKIELLDINDNILDDMVNQADKMLKNGYGKSGDLDTNYYADTLIDRLVEDVNHNALEQLDYQELQGVIRGNIETYMSLVNNHNFNSDFKQRMRKEFIENTKRFIEGYNKALVEDKQEECQ